MCMLTTGKSIWRVILHYLDRSLDHLSKEPKLFSGVNRVLPTRNLQDASTQPGSIVQQV